MKPSRVLVVAYDRRRCPYPDPARSALSRRLEARRQQRWPELSKLAIRYRGLFAYVEGTTSEGDSLPLFRLRYLGSPDDWGFAVYLASKDGYEARSSREAASRAPPKKPSIALAAST